MAAREQEPAAAGTVPGRPYVGGTEQRCFLLVIHGGAATTHVLPESGEVVIGRAAECDVAIDDPSLSRRHAVLRMGPPLSLEDLDSANGTRVRGTALTGGAPVSLGLGEIAEVGSTTLVVQRGSTPVSTLRFWPHGYFEGRVEEECARSARTGGEFAVLHIRHEPGAAGVVESLAALLRPDDVMGKYGPGTLEILLQEAGRADAEELAQRLGAAVAPSAALRVGFACCPDDGRAASALLERAAMRARGATVSEDAAPVVVGGTAMEQVFRLAERAAAGSISVLLLGETGVGKEVMAERLHRLSPRKDKPFLRLNCAALSETLIESELFGHEKGSFTGAGATKPGLLETADGGTVFLDEVGELPMGVQVKLLRVLEERQVLRVGALKAREIDVRFVAATNRDLDEEIAKGAFRRDLYYRIAGITLVIPPLRERTEEIAKLAQAFIAKAARELAVAEPTLAPEALALLKAYSWPGNIRELRNFAERAVLLCTAGRILPEHLPLEKMIATVGTTTSTGGGALPIAPGAAPTPEDPRKQRILEALEKAAGNQTEAAALLGVSRRTLSTWLDVHRIPRPRKGRSWE